MDKEFIAEVRKDLKTSLNYHTDHLISIDGSIDTYHDEKIKIYAFLCRILDAVLTPLERFIPEKQDEETQKDIGVA
jgi:hypothetical protein